MDRKIVEVGRAFSAEILAVHAGRLTYAEASGETCSVDLGQCHERYLSKVSGSTGWRRDPATGERVAVPWREPPGNKTVGYRQAVSHRPGVWLLSDPGLHFVFESHEEARRLLIEPLRADGWRTWDMD